jgi:hypothetical protein
MPSVVHLGVIAILATTLMAAQATAGDKYFDSAGVNVRYIEQGAGEPVILLHGYTNR